MPKYDIEVAIPKTAKHKEIVDEVRSRLTSYLVHVVGLEPLEARVITNRYAIAAFAGDENTIMKITKEYVNVRQSKIQY